MKTVIIRMLSVIIMAVLLISVSAACKPATAAEAGWQAIVKKGELVMGLDDSFPPMGFRDKNNEIVGFDVDLAKEVTKRLNLKLRLQPIDWTAKQQELDGGTIDCLWNGYSKTDERERDNSLSLPYMKNAQVFVVLKDSPAKKIADLKGMRLAIQAGSSANEALDAVAGLRASFKEVVEFKDNTTALMDVSGKTTDAVLLDLIVADYYIATSAPDKLRVLDDTLAPEEYVIGFKKSNTLLRDKINEQLKKMAADGTLAKISNDWFGRDITTIDK